MTVALVVVVWWFVLSFVAVTAWAAWRWAVIAGSGSDRLRVPGAAAVTPARRRPDGSAGGQSPGPLHSS